MNMKFYYLIRFQYLGFRFHGWLKQSAHKTIQGQIEEALSELLQSPDFQVLGASRTDSMVSARESFFELITEKEIILSDFPDGLNKRLPPDIKILEAKEVNSDFKIISSAKEKEYRYYFAFGGEKLHPFCAPFMAMINENLDLEKIKKAAELFQGEHNFFSFCYKKREGQNFIRVVDHASLETSTDFQGSFFPAKSFVFIVKAQSFLRHQVRLMAGALLMVGMNQLSLEELELILKGESERKIMTAPASGLILHKITYKL